MSKIQGRVIYDTRRVQLIEPQSQSIINVPVFLYNITTGLGIGVLTNNNGSFSFENVINGDYRIVEAWGADTTNIGTVDYSKATAISAPIPKDPPITAVTNPDPSANKLDSTSPNTIIVKVAEADITNLIFFDAPIVNRSLSIVGNILGDNLIKNANKGNWGELPTGSDYETIEETNPYPNMLSGLEYRNEYPPRAGEITVTNTVNTYGEWWYITDHTHGDETGRVLVVNGANPGAVFFKETITVEPNSNYLLSMWITNLDNPRYFPYLSEPRMGIRVTNKDSEIIYSEDLNDLPTASPLTWTELGGVFNSGNNTELTLALSTENPDATGNDYAIDDITIRKFEFSNVLNIEKKADKTIAYSNAPLTYDIIISNKSPFKVENVLFQDKIDLNTTFIPGSVTVDESNVGYENSDPTTGFNIGTIEPNSQKTVQFKVQVNSVPGNGVIHNKATASYIYLKSENDDIFRMNVESNDLPTNVFTNQFGQQIIDVIESIALEQTALSHIINAEAKKIKKFTELPNNTNDDLIAINKSVKETIDAISALEIVLHKKAETVSCLITDSTPID